MGLFSLVSPILPFSILRQLQSRLRPILKSFDLIDINVVCLLVSDWLSSILISHEPVPCCSILCATVMHVCKASIVWVCVALWLIRCSLFYEIIDVSSNMHILSVIDDADNRCLLEYVFKVGLCYVPEF